MNPPIWAAISALCALASLCLAVWTNVLRSKTKTAKMEAERARDEAERHLDAVERMASSVEGPYFTIRAVDPTSPRCAVWYLRSQRRHPQTITEFVNRSEISNFDLETPLTLAPYESRQFTAVGSGNTLTPMQLVVRVDGMDGLVYVPWG